MESSNYGICELWKVQVMESSSGGKFELWKIRVKESYWDSTANNNKKNKIEIGHSLAAYSNRYIIDSKQSTFPYSQGPST